MGINKTRINIQFRTGLLLVCFLSFHIFISCTAGGGQLSMYPSSVERVGVAGLCILDQDGSIDLLATMRLGNSRPYCLMLRNSPKVALEKFMKLKDNHGRTILMLAVENKLSDLVELLLEKGKELQGGQIDRFMNLEDSHGDTALIWAISGGSVKIAKLLLSAGADFLHQNNDGNTALILAAKNGSMCLVKSILDRLYKLGDDQLFDEHLNIQNSDGNTALIHAVQHGDVEVTDLLLSSGADLLYQNREGNTALILAVQGDSIELVKLLVEHAEGRQLTKQLLTLRNHNCDIPLTIAKRIHSLIVSQFLVEKYIVCSLAE